MKKLVVFGTLLFSIVIGPISVVRAAVVSISVVDKQNQPVEDAVIEVVSVNEESSISKDSSEQIEPSTTDTSLHEVAQRNRTFIPFVSAIKVGSKVDFPNYDQTRHHVYSFSKAKPFELKLYVGRPDTSILFDKEGIVALGCNIHDYMQAYIYVGSSDFLAVSALDKSVQFDLSDGDYQLNVWHPWQLAPGLQMNLVLRKGQVLVDDTLKPDNKVELQLAIERKEKPAPPQSALQDLFEGEQ